jgi:hypothetical protein
LEGFMAAKVMVEGLKRRQGTDSGKLVTARKPCVTMWAASESLTRRKTIMVRNL